MNITEQAVEAAARSIHDVHCGCGEKDRYEYSAINVEQAERALEAALPHIRAQIAADIRHQKTRGYNVQQREFDDTLEFAARIAEEGALE